MKRKKLALLLFFGLTASSSYAQLNGDGYYRVQNQYTERYINVIDNRGSINYSTTDADLGAIETLKGFDKIVSKPGTVIYIQTINNDGYNLKSQGTDTYKIISYYVQLRKNTDGTYRAYGEASGLVKYLCDEKTKEEEGVLLTNSSSTRDWYIKPITAEGDNYFGITPEFSIGTDYYSSFYASFPFSFASNGMTAYYVDKVQNGMAVMKEVTAEAIPAATPVIIKSSSFDVSQNKLNLLPSTNTSITGSLLRGAYFQNSNPTHYNQVANNPETMRVLGTTSSGKLGFIKSDVDFLPANKAYLVVPQGTPDELELVSHEEFLAGTNAILADPNNDVSEVYSVNGQNVSNSRFNNQAKKGIYIVNGKKVRY